jgi:sigma-E factor negative regulatory protein RseC
MSASTTIQHKGFIESISEEGAKVRFTTISACADCHAKGVCSASDMKDKELTIRDISDDFRVGERVDILLSLQQGSHAVLIGYVYPFLLFLMSLLIISAAGFGEVIAGTISLSLLLPYYLGIYIFRRKISRKFNFTIRKEI